MVDFRRFGQPLQFLALAAKVGAVSMVAARPA
jgi:hypothetical protein